MSELKAHAGNGPADPSANGGSPRDVIVQDMLPASVNLREELAECRSLMAECARLASASAQAAGAIARLCDSETKRRLAIARMDVLPNPPPRRSLLKDWKPDIGDYEPGAPAPWSGRSSNRKKRRSIPGTNGETARYEWARRTARQSQPSRHRPAQRAGADVAGARARLRAPPPPRRRAGCDGSGDAECTSAGNLTLLGRRHRLANRRRRIRWR